MRHNMKMVENVDRSGSVLRYDPKIGLPHVAANEPQLSASLRSKPVEETPECPGCAVATYPEQPPFSGVELAGQGDKLVLFLSPADLVSVDGRHICKITICETPFHGRLDSMEDILPKRCERFSRPPARKDASPNRRGTTHRLWSDVFSPPLPRNPFDLDAAIGAVDSSHGIHEEYGDSPQGNEFKPAPGLGVIPRSEFATTGADWPTAFAWPDLYLQNRSPILFMKTDLAIHKTFVKLNPIQYRLYLHPVSPPLALDILVDLHNAKKGNGMLYFQAPSGNILNLPTCSSALTETHRFCRGALYFNTPFVWAIS